MRERERMRIPKKIERKKKSARFKSQLNVQKQQLNNNKIQNKERKSINFNLKIEKDRK